MILYVATSNPGKLREFATSASAAGIEVLPLPHLESITAPEENAATFMGNAELKARAYSLAVRDALPGALVLADDSGLEVDALGGDPGVRSARFAADAGFTEGANANQRNNAYLRARLSTLPPDAPHTGRFRCALAVARDGVIIHRAEGSVEGKILNHSRGTGGFGYDPLFLVPELGLTLAELAPEQKWRISHRGRAFRALLAQLQSG